MGKILLGLIIVALIVMLLLRNKKQGSAGHKTSNKARRGGEKTARITAVLASKGSPAEKTTPKPWQSVSIKTRLGACNAAIAAQDTVYLANEAPSLPLAECDVDTCGCRYVYHDDRRQEDRRSPFGENHGAQHGGPEGNRREGDNRRC